MSITHHQLGLLNLDSATMSSRAKRSTTRKSYNETIDEEQGELLNSAEDSKFINDDSDDFEGKLIFYLPLLLPVESTCWTCLVIL